MNTTVAANAGARIAAADGDIVAENRLAHAASIKSNAEAANVAWTGDGEMLEEFAAVTNTVALRV